MQVANPEDEYDGKVGIVLVHDITNDDHGYNIYVAFDDGRTNAFRSDQLESDTQPLGANHFAIRVDAIDAAVTDLQEQGVEVQRIPFIPGAGHQAFLHDPFGNLLELNQPE